MDYDDFIFGSKYKEIMIRFSGICSKNNANIIFMIPTHSGYWQVFGNPTITSSCTYEILFKDEKLNETVKSKVQLERITNSTGSFIAFLKRIEKSATEIDSLKIFLNGDATFPAGTVVNIYGKEA